MRILVIDDHPLFREGLSYALQGLADDVEVIESESYEAAETVLDGNAPDLVLADLCLPWEDGREGIASLIERIPEVPVVIVSVLDDREEVLRSLENGAKGFIPKSSSTDVMLSAIRLVLAGGVYLPPTLLVGAESEARQLRRAVSGEPVARGVRSPIDDLTPRQRDVLELLKEGKSNQEIADSMGLKSGTVKIHVTAILKKLGLKNRTQVALMATRNGVTI